MDKCGFVKKKKKGYLLHNFITYPIWWFKSAINTYCKNDNVLVYFSSPTNPFIIIASEPLPPPIQSPGAPYLNTQSSCSSNKRQFEGNLINFRD